MQNDITIVDDGIARLTAMLRQKKHEASKIRVLGGTIESPRSKHGATWTTLTAKPSMAASGSLHSEPTLRVSQGAS